MAWSSISEANRAEPSFVPGLNAGGDARPVNLVTTRIRPYIGSCDREQAAGVIGGRQEEMAGAVRSAAPRPFLAKLSVVSCQRQGGDSIRPGVASPDVV
jgi:hypothetical protein